MTTDGGGYVAVDRGAPAFMPHIAPDGNRVLYALNPDNIAGAAELGAVTPRRIL